MFKYLVKWPSGNKTFLETLSPVARGDKLTNIAGGPWLVNDVEHAQGPSGIPDTVLHVASLKL